MKYIIVDIDGVLNPGNPKSDFYYPVNGSRVISRNTNAPDYIQARYPITLNRVQGQWLKSLAERCQAKLVWGTSWKEFANSAVGAKIGLPEMPCLPLRREKPGESYGEVKAMTVSKYTRGNKFVYFDDQADLGVDLKDHNGIHIYVDPRVGLTQSHIQVAEAFLLSKEDTKWEKSSQYAWDWSSQ